MPDLEWQGMTEALLNFSEKWPRDLSQGISDLTSDLQDMLVTEYKANLSGDSPSTAANPLPVGIRTGDLLNGVSSTQDNQYSFTLTNPVEHAGWIEDGTETMEPRHPLQTAVDTMESELEDKAQEMLDKVFN